MARTYTTLLGQILVGTLIASAGIAAAAPIAPAPAKTPKIIYDDDPEYAEHKKSSTVSVSVNNDDVTVIIDGKRIPDDRIKIEDDGQIIILGEDGEKIRALNTFTWRGPASRPGFVKGPTGGWTVAPGQAQGFSYLPRATQEAPKAPPPVMVGVNMSEPGDALRYHLGISEDKKAILIDRVVDGLPADKAGLRRFDVIVSIEGSVGADGDRLHDVLMGKSPGDTLEMMVIRAGSPTPVKLDLVAYDAEKLAVLDMGLTVDIQPNAFAFPGSGNDALAWALRNNQQMDSDEMRALVERELARVRRDNLFIDDDGDLIVRQNADRARERLERLNAQMREQALIAEQRAREAGLVAQDRIAELEARLEAMEGKLAATLDRLADRLESLADRLDEREDED